MQPMFRMEEADYEGAYCCEESWEEVTYPLPALVS